MNARDSQFRVSIVRLLAFVWPLRGMMIFSVSMRILNQFFGIALLVAACAGLAQLATAEKTHGEISKIIWNGATTLAVLGLGKAIFRYLEQFSGHAVAFRLLSFFRYRLYEKLEILAPAGLTSLRSGDMVSRLISDIDRMEVFYAHTIAPAMTAVVIPLLAWATLAMLHPLLAWSTLPFLLAVGAGIPWLTYRTGRGFAYQCRTETAGLNAHFTDSIQGLRDILAFNAEDRREKELTDRGHHLNRNQFSLALTAAGQMAASDLLIGVSIALNLVIGAFLVQAGVLSFTGLAMAIALTVGAFVPLLAITTLIPDLAQALASAGRLFSIMDAVSECAEESEDLQSIQLSRSSILFRNVSFAYPGRPAHQVLNNVSFTIEPGEAVALIGSSGAGKSTILQLLLRFWNPTTGSIWLGDHRIDHLPPHLVRETIAVVSQHTHLFNTTVRENLLLAKPDAMPEELIRVARQANIHDFITSLPQQYDTIIGEMGTKLSGGQRQRLAIARAILKDAPILIFDEATAHLDAANEQAILETVCSWWRQSFSQGKRTLIMITHRHATLRYVNRVLSLENGEIAQASER